MITFSQDMDNDRIVLNWNYFYKIEHGKFIEPIYKSTVEVINGDLKIRDIVIKLPSFILVIVTSYQPIMKMKRVSVQKLLSVKDRTIKADDVKCNLYLLISMTLVINIGMYFTLDYKPKDIYPMLLECITFLLLQFFIIAYLTYLIIQIVIDQINAETFFSIEITTHLQ